MTHDEIFASQIDASLKAGMSGPVLMFFMERVGDEMHTKKIAHVLGQPVTSPYLSELVFEGHHEGIPLFKRN
jgi:hypothetical protein